jgi:hypothetical protein
MTTIFRRLCRTFSSLSNCSFWFISTSSTSRLRVSVVRGFGSWVRRFLAGGAPSSSRAPAPELMLSGDGELSCDERCEGSGEGYASKKSSDGGVGERERAESGELAAENKVSSMSMLIASEERLREAQAVVILAGTEEDWCRVRAGKCVPNTSVWVVWRTREVCEVEGGGREENNWTRWGERRLSYSSPAVYLDCFGCADRRTRASKRQRINHARIRGPALFRSKLPPSHYFILSARPKLTGTAVTSCCMLQPFVPGQWHGRSKYESTSKATTQTHCLP